MLIGIAMPNIDDDTLPAFVIARLAERDRCPVLGRPLQVAVSRLVGGMTVVLVDRDESGELRTFGDERLTATLPGIDLERQCWMSFKLPDGGDAPTDLDLAA